MQRSEEELVNKGRNTETTQRVVIFLNRRVKGICVCVWVIYIYIYIYV